MHLISTLASGVAGAENGSVTIYRRGTSTRATTYSDFYGASANASGDLTLDSNGGVVVYVNQLVDCTVKSSTGATVRSFTAGDETTAIQYSGTAFTGVDPVTGVSAINKPANLKAILDLFRTSFGTTNASVSFGGANRNLYEVLAGLDCFYNVKDPLYGALGDGTTDDASAIQSAMDAAAADGGGIVFFPAGTYRTVATLVPGAGVSLMGAGPQVTKIANTGDGDGSNVTLAFGADTAGSVRGVCRFISGLNFDPSASHTSAQVRLDDAVFAIFRDCNFGVSSTNAVGDLVIGDGGTTSGHVAFENCAFSVNATGKFAIADLDDAALSLRGCYFGVNVDTYSGQIVATAGETALISDCEFDGSTISSGGYTGIQAGRYGTGSCQVSNCRFVGASGSYAFGYTAGEFHEGGCYVSGGMSLYGSTIVTAANMDSCHLGSRDNRQLDVSLPDTTAVTVSLLEYGNIYVSSSGGAGSRTIHLADAPAGCIATILMINAGSGSHTFRVLGAAGGYQSIADRSVSVGSVSGTVVRSVYISGDAQWYGFGIAAAYP